MRDAVMNWLDQQQDAMIELLRETVNIDSGSYNKVGVDTVGAVLRAHMQRNEISCEIVAHATYGDCMRASVPAANGAVEKPVMLMGHCDTVFPDASAAERPFRIQGELAYGPGVADMKGGLVLNTFVLEAFARAGGGPVPLVGLYTSDEELGSPSSRPIIEAEARKARAVLNAEPGRPNGNLVIGRRGASFMEIEVTGKASHAGANPQAGASAIEALCRKVLKLHALSDFAAGTSVNVGLINGGSSVNTIAARACASIDARFTTTETMNAIHTRIDQILQETEIAGTATRLLWKRGFLPLMMSSGSEALFKTYVEAAQKIGFAVEGEFAGGSADSGFTASVGAPTLCATGPVGGNAHSPDEYLRVDTMVPRAKAVALTVMRLVG